MGKISNEMYWGKEINDKFREYISLSADKDAQNQIFDKWLYVPLSKMIESLVWAFIPPNYDVVNPSKEDLKMECMTLIISIPYQNYNFDKSVFNYLTTSIINYLCKRRKKIGVSLKETVNIEEIIGYANNDANMEHNSGIETLKPLTPSYSQRYLYDDVFIGYFKKALKHKLEDEFLSPFLKRFYSGLLYIYENYSEMEINKKKIKKLLSEHTGLTQDRLNLYLKKYYPNLIEITNKIRESENVQKYIS